MTAETVARLAIPAPLVGRETARIEAGILEAGAQVAQRLSVLVEEFLAADGASRAAHEAALLQNNAVADEEAERLYGEVEDAAELLIAGWWASRLTVPEDVLAAAREYTGRRRRVVQAPVAMDWDALDWGKSRRAA